MTVTKDVAETARELVELYKRERDEARREVERLEVELKVAKRRYAADHGIEYRYSVGDHR